MTLYLLDTDVISRISPLSGGAGAEFASWIREVGEECFLSVISLAELQAGLTKLVRQGSQRRAGQLERWIEDTVRLFSDRLILVDPPIARRTGELIHASKVAGHQTKFEDTCIAATADIRGMTVVTFNLRHFAPLGVRHQLPGR